MMGLGSEFSGEPETPGQVVSNRDIQRLIVIVQDLVAEVPRGSNHWMRVKERVLAQLDKEERKDLEEFSSWFLNL
jgi:hypothetical protein